MIENGNKTASYQIIADAGGSRYRFFCGASGMAVCTTQPIRAETQEKELHIAWENEGRHHFNHCQRCGGWVSDVMYNADTGCCVTCSPWEELPAFCPNCGERVPQNNYFCGRCGKKLQYGEVTADADDI